MGMWRARAKSKFCSSTLAQARHLHVGDQARLSSTDGDFKNSSADRMVWTHNPSDVTRLFIAQRIESSSSMIEMMGASGNCRSSVKPQLDEFRSCGELFHQTRNMSCGTAQVSYQGIRISLKLLAVFLRDCALAALDLTGPSPSRRQETENRNPRRSRIRRLLSIVGDGDRVWSLLPVASCGPAQRLFTGIRRKTRSTEDISRKHPRANALAS